MAVHRRMWLEWYTLRAYIRSYHFDPRQQNLLYKLKDFVAFQSPFRRMLIGCFSLGQDNSSVSIVKGYGRDGTFSSPCTSKIFYSKHQTPPLGYTQPRIDRIQRNISKSAKPTEWWGWPLAPVSGQECWIYIYIYPSTRPNLLVLY
jgi:hypothetical protein